MVRLQKYLADAGVASRRGGEQIILAGRVTVNGETVAELGAKVGAHDQVAVDGKPIRAKRKIYLALHKPRGLVCSRNDELGRPTIYELPAEGMGASAFGGPAGLQQRGLAVSDERRRV